MQPGDNFRVVATTIHQHASNPTVDLTNLEAQQMDGLQARVKDAGGNFIAVDFFDHPPPPPQAVMASDMLTVWRKLHMEVDS